MKPFIFLFVVTFSIAFSPVAFARWGTKEDAPIVSRSNKSEIVVNADGTWRAKSSTLYRVNNEDGRISFGTGAIKYNSRTTQIKDIQAESRNGDDRIKVEKDYIEDKALASSSEGFDETRQVSIAYPRVEVGTELFLSYEQVTREVPIPGFYSDEFSFGDHFYEESSQIVLKSPFKLLISKNDPGQHLEVKQEASGKDFVTTIKLIKPIYNQVAEEIEPKASRRLLTWVAVSTQPDWGAMAKPLVSEYEKVLSAQLPDPLAKIASEAEKKSDLTDRINIVTSRLADTIRYLGDWRDVRGGHVPRPLSLVANTRFGDCKDFSAATVAILRKLGYQAYVAWVQRGVIPEALPPIPVETAFNHAIVYLKIGDKVKWIDPTNTVSFAQGTFEDIMGRQALIVDPKSPRLEWIPEGVPTDSTGLRSLRLKFLKGGDAQVFADILYSGRSAVGVTGIERQYSKETINHIITKAIADDHYIVERKVDDYQLSSRVVRDIRLKAYVKVKGYQLTTTAGPGYGIPRGGISKLVDMETGPRVSDFFLGFPNKDRVTYHLDGVSVVGTLPKTCKIQSQWLTFERRYKKQKGELLIDDELTILKSVIPVEALKAKEYGQLQESLAKCVNKAVVVFR